MSHSTATARDSEWIVFSSDVITPLPSTFQTEDWGEYIRAEDVEFRGYTFEYPRRWAFTGYSVFDDEKGRKVAEIAPGVIALAPSQSCFDKAPPDTVSDGRARSFRYEGVEGKFNVSNVVFDDSQEEFRVHSYCIQEKRLAFTVTFLERSNQPKLPSEFRHIIRSFKFVKTAPP
ncbi:MAG: hypothetical protein IPG93_08235 [Burkholderiales bacterium]|nr:hypothetical protein [Burkholderiales bacterium]